MSTMTPAEKMIQDMEPAGTVTHIQKPPQALLLVIAGLILLFILYVLTDKKRCDKDSDCMDGQYCSSNKVCEYKYTPPVKNYYICDPLVSQNCNNHLTRDECEQFMRDSDEIKQFTGSTPDGINPFGCVLEGDTVEYNNLNLFPDNKVICKTSCGRLGPGPRPGPGPVIPAPIPVIPAPIPGPGPGPGPGPVPEGLITTYIGSSNDLPRDLTSGEVNLKSNRPGTGDILIAGFGNEPTPPMFLVESVAEPKSFDLYFFGDFSRCMIGVSATDPVEVLGVSDNPNSDGHYLLTKSALPNNVATFIFEKSTDGNSVVIRLEGTNLYLMANNNSFDRIEFRDITQNKVESMYKFDIEPLSMPAEWTNRLSTIQI